MKVFGYNRYIEGKKTRTFRMGFFFGIVKFDRTSLFLQHFNEYFKSTEVSVSRFNL